MNLGSLIYTLSALPPDLPVRYESGEHPTQFFSWRGIYEELTLHEGYGEWDSEAGNYKPVPPITVAELLAKAKEADGATFEGYKGGDYKMGRHTPVWADPYGEYRCDAITGASVQDGAVVLSTLNISEYR